VFGVFCRVEEGGGGGVCLDLSVNTGRDAAKFRGEMPQ